MRFNFYQAKQIVELFGNEDAGIHLIEGDGHSGQGLYAHFDTDKGAFFIPAEPVTNE